MRASSHRLPGAAETRVLVVEDEPSLQEAVVEYLRLEGHAAAGVGSLAAAREWLARQACDIVVLDLGLPDGDGLELLRAELAGRGLGVIITTARGDQPQRVAGVRAGADNYLVKPIDLEELASLIANLARRLRPAAERADTPAAPAGAPQPWTLSRLRWTLASPDGRTVKLTHSEAMVLSMVAQRPGQPVARADLVTALGHQPDYYDPRRMEVLVRRLRSKCASAFGVELPLDTVHGLGYAFTAPLAVN